MFIRYAVFRHMRNMPGIDGENVIELRYVLFSLISIFLQSSGVASNISGFPLCFSCTADYSVIAGVCQNPIMLMIASAMKGGTLLDVVLLDPMITEM